MAEDRPLLTIPAQSGEILRADTPPELKLPAVNMGVLSEDELVGTKGMLYLGAEARNCPELLTIPALSGEYFDSDLAMEFVAVLTGFHTCLISLPTEQISPCKFQLEILHHLLYLVQQMPWKHS